MKSITSVRVVHADITLRPSRKSLQTLGRHVAETLGMKRGIQDNGHLNRAPQENTRKRYERSAQHAIVPQYRTKNHRPSPMLNLQVVNSDGRAVDLDGRQNLVLLSYIDDSSTVRSVGPSPTCHGIRKGHIMEVCQGNLGTIVI